MKKLGLCLGSGGARGIAHVGFLQAIIENDVPIYAISGCSMGSLVGALYLYGYTPSKMLDLALSLKKSDLLDPSPAIIKNKAIFRSEKLDKLLSSFFGEIEFDDLSKPFSCIATDLYSGQTHTFTSGKVRNAVRASCSIPIGFTPVKLDNMLLVDGGICNRTPVKEVRDLGADVVVAVDVLAELPETEKINSIFDLGFRALDIMGINVSYYRDEAQKPELMLLPELGKTSQYKIEKQQFIYDQGYKLGIENIDKIKKLIED